jgi:NADPH:quinone reductase-like Zn-dependent oxidoreductase
VTGVCGTANVEYVRSLGADAVFDYRSQDWRAAGAVYDVIFDAAGSSSFSAARAHLAPAGWCINTYPPASLMIAAPFLRVFSRQRAVPFMLKTTAAQLGELARLADAGVLRPRIARTVALEDVAAAQRDMKDGKVGGKVCVRVAA